MVADINAARLTNAKKLGPVIRALDVSGLNAESDVGQALESLVGHQVVDCGCECVGFECTGFGRSADKANREEAVMNVNQIQHSVFVPLVSVPPRLTLSFTR